jgi:endoglucanase
VEYKVNGTVKPAGYYTDSSQITITAEALSGYYLSGTTSWSRNAAPVTTPTATATPTPTVSSTPTPTATTAPTTAPSTGGNVSSTWKIASSWGTGYVANLSITALADAKTWKVSWQDPYATSISNSWGMKCSIASPVITCVGADWTTSLKKGQVVSAGVQVNSTKTPVNPILSY